MENKTCWVRARVSESDKEKIERYCKEHHLTISELVRISCDFFMEEKK